MPEKFIEFKAVVLKNNCPQCYSKDGLRLTFKQKIVETTFYKTVTSEIQNQLECKTCNSTVYPVQWTDDIERVVDYQKKALKPKKTSTYLKKMGWLVIVLCILLVAATVFSVLYTQL